MAATDKNIRIRSQKSSDTQKANALNQLINKINAMGYEFVSNDEDNFLVECKRCHLCFTIKRSKINAYYKNSDYRFCPDCDGEYKVKQIIEGYNKGEITGRSMISSIKQDESLIAAIERNTTFLNAYENIDVVERLYYIVHNLTDVVKCKCCDNKASWTGRLTEGYHTTCGSKECISKETSLRMDGSTHISSMRDKAFKQWQAGVEEIDDDLIKRYIIYDKFVEFVDNPIILKYLQTRFDDSESLVETVQRIRIGVDVKPKCECCGKPVTWIGRKDRLYTRFCSNRCAGMDENMRKQRIATQIEHWGTENVYDSPQYRQMMKEKYGVEYTFQREDVKEKIVNTNVERYGCQHPSSSDIVKEKVKATNIERYGVMYTFMSDEIRERIKQTNLERYGVENVFQSKEIYSKIIQTNIERYGVPYVLQSDVIKEKIRQHNRELYGVDVPSQNNEIKDKIRQSVIDTNMKRYGVRGVQELEEYKEKTKRTVQEKYGVDCVLQNEEIKEKIKNTNLKRYGVINPLQNEEICKKAYLTKKAFGLHSTSKEEISVGEYISSLGIEVLTHYKSDAYPYNCDFYLPEYDLYIEYQGSQYHNYRSFLGTDDDYKELDVLKENADRRKKETGKDYSQYDNMIHVWAFSDVEKRTHASLTGLNYLEIYRYNCIEDVYKQLSFYLGCLQGLSVLNIDEKTLQAEYEYYKKLAVSDDGVLVRLPNYRVSIVKQYQQCEFYKNEMDIYAHDPLTRRILIENRKKYLHKEEYELTPNDILTGFKKSGLYYGYSHFNSLWTNWFVNKYDIKTVYDPCGGWGHHFLGMLKCDRIIYNDFNERVCENVKRIKEDFSIDALEIHNNDGRFYEPDDVDAFFMCPPYYNVETYNDKTFKDLDDYKDFLNKIFCIWKKNKSKIFCIIIREDFIDLIDAKPVEVYELTVGRMKHFSHNRKHNEEKLYIFKK